MKLAPAMEEFIQYKQVLGNSYNTPARTLKAFLKKTGNLELDALTTQHSDACLPVQSGIATSAWFHRYWALGCFFRFATSRGYMRPRILPTSMPDRPSRFVPYIYSTEDIRRLLAVPDSHYPPACPLTPDTMLACFTGYDKYLRGKLTWLLKQRLWQPVIQEAGIAGSKKGGERIRA